MWGRGKKTESQTGGPPNVLKDAVREARIEAAERSAVVVDLRDADVARLELLSDALDPTFKDIPEGVDLFDRGVSRGDVPRLWVDVIAHVEMGHDKRHTVSCRTPATAARCWRNLMTLPRWCRRSRVTWRAG